jgi:hypothetical protein
MRKIVLSLFSTICCLFFLLPARTQVLNSDITLSTQALVDAFNWTQVNGTITITGSGITNLNGLSELTKCQSLVISNNPGLTNIIGLANLGEVEHNLTIRQNSILTNITGFSSLTTVGQLNVDALTIDNNDNLLNVDGLFSLNFATKLIISGNAKLANLNGLSALTSVEHFFIISDNPLLMSLAGLSHLSSISSTSGNLTIDNNDALTNVNGLSGLTYAAGLIIENNSALSNLDALSHLTQVQFGGLTIDNNDALTNIDGLNGITLLFGDLIVTNNQALLNVDGLSHIGGLNNLDARHNLEIKDNPSLTNVDGLSSVVGVRDGDLAIQNNDALTNIDGLSKLTLVGEVLIISDNLLLTNVDGLSHLEAVGGMTIDHNSALTNLDGLSALKTVIRQLSIQFNPSLTDFCGLYNLFHTGEIGGAITIKNNGANTLSVTPLAPVTVNADQGLCSAVVSELLIGSATVEGCLGEITGGHSDFPSGDIFPVGTTNILWSATDAAGNTATAIQTVTVVDNQPPVIVSWPSDVTVSCAADVPVADNSLITAMDNCPNVTVTHLDDVISNQTCANRFTVTRTYVATDHAGNTATQSQVIVVNDNIPPQITGLSTSQSSLWPANHTMRDITVNYTVSDNCVTDPPFSISISSNEPVNGTADGDTDPDWEIIDNHHIRLRAERAANGNGRIYTITVTVDDGCNAPVTVSTQVMVVHNITGPVTGHPFRVGSTVDLAGEFWDKPANKHTATWLIDDNVSVKGSITEPAGTKNGKAIGAYKFITAGVYKLQMNITDQNKITSYANTNGDLEAIVVIYDPNGGNTYGGGYYNSPAGALKSNPSATGKASYGFAMNYFKNSTNPKGETQFEFKVGDFEFNALNFEYLVISNSMAQFKGTGKIIGGQSGVGFTMTVVDGQLDGSGTDKIRMKIYNKNTGAVIYDNQPGASDAALPTQAVGPNSTIVIQSNTGNALSTTTSQQIAEESKSIDDLEVRVNPNPASTYFNVTIKSNNTKEKIALQVFDQYGRSIEVRSHIPNGATIRVGDLYRPGAYYIRVLQGMQHKEIKLIKVSD